MLPLDAVAIPERLLLGVHGEVGGLVRRGRGQHAAAGRRRLGLHRRHAVLQVGRFGGRGCRGQGGGGGQAAQGGVGGVLRGQLLRGGLRLHLLAQQRDVLDALELRGVAEEPAIGIVIVN